MNSPSIIFEDNHLIAVNKPAGMPTQADDSSDPSLLEWTREYIRNKYNKPGNVFTGLLHRLDRPVSGIVCFARTSKAAGRLSEQFRARTTQKIYHAIVEGHPARPEATLKNWLIPGKGATRNSSKIAVNKQPDAKQAELRYKILKQLDNRTLLEITLLTGLKHQIRAQLAFIGNPIVGDFRYSPAKIPVTGIAQGHAILLHAQSLTITHPTRKETLTFTADYPQYFSL